MHKSNNTDRRFRSDDELQQHLVKPRFTDSEIAAVETEAAMLHGGKLATLVREAAMLGIEVMRQRRRSLIESIQSGDIQPSQDEEIASLLAAMATRNIASSRSLAQQNTA